MMAHACGVRRGGAFAFTAAGDDAPRRQPQSEPATLFRGGRFGVSYFCEWPWAVVECLWAASLCSCAVFA
jgi:hypothetical protein